ncbi:MAG: type II-A CRISPR-associated protein Csn2 [Clostridiales bacterium]|nr:type II-A CRISPR-associated protein Csn2 [Clostridiales bacterium]
MPLSLAWCGIEALSLQENTSKSITNLLIKKFSEFLGFGEQTEALNSLESIILNLAEDFRLKSGLNIEYDTTVNGVNLSKVCSLKISDEKRSLIEKLCEYVNLLCELKPLKLFILVFGKEFLSEKDILDFYKHCFDRSVRLMFVEGTDKSSLLPIERRLVIDEDMCEIPQGYDEFEK